MSITAFVLFFYFTYFEEIFFVRTLCNVLYWKLFILESIVLKTFVTKYGFNVSRVIFSFKERYHFCSNSLGCSFFKKSNKWAKQILVNVYLIEVLHCRKWALGRIRICRLREHTSSLLKFCKI